MVGSFYGLDMMRKALQAQQMGLMVTGQNVSNANSKGYSRQEVYFAATDPFDVMTPQGIGQVGTGVTEQSVVRYRSQFLDLQYRSYNAGLGFYSQSGKTMDQIQHILNEPSDAGLGEALDTFWTAVHDLSNRPADTDARVKLIQAAQGFLDRSNTIYQSLSQLRQDLNSTLQIRVQQVNEMTKQVADLNHQIQVATTEGQHPNDLMDRRDTIVDTLSKQLGVQVATQSDGQVNLFLGGQALVMGNTFSTLALQTRSDQMYNVVWADTGNAVNLPPQQGELGSLIYGRDTQVPTYASYVNQLVTTVASKFDSQHMQGYDLTGTTGRHFFNVPATVLQPSDIHIDPAILSDPTKIAAAGTPPVGGTNGPNDNRNALALWGLQSAPMLAFGTGPAVSSDAYYQAAVTQLGLDAKNSLDRSSVLTAQVDSADRERGSIQGVSLDEEMTKMIQFQQAYNAAARMVTALDNNLSTIVEKMGLVGR